MDWGIASITLAAAAAPAQSSFGPTALRVAAIALAFGLTVFVHELGHFLTARLAGMAVYEFSIGFGRPLLLWFKRGGTQYSFRLWPFLSYVRIAGMEPGDEHPQGFLKKPRWAQAIVLVTGCLMNFLLAVAIFIAMGLVFGKAVPSNVVKEIAKDSPAAQVGLAPGDRLIGINGTRLSLDQLRAKIKASPGKQLALELERAGRRLALRITPEAILLKDVEGLNIVDRKIGRIGVGFDYEIVPMGVLESIATGFTDTHNVIRLQIVGFLGLARRQVPTDEVMGPVRFVGELYRAARESWLQFLNVAAILTIAVGFVNLLPIPPLDGSRLVIVAYEAIRRKPVDKRKETIVHLVGLALLMALILLITYRDIRLLTHPGGG